jgi:hypothetical protein
MKKILFLALHLGYGGVEQATVNEANLLSEYFDVTIAVIYKLFDFFPFSLDKSVKVVYLLKETPNKAELILKLRQFDIIGALCEIIKSVKILYNKRVSIVRYLMKNQYDVIISTRYYFNVIISKKYKGGASLLAREHRHHNDDKIYIKKICHSVRNFEYFLPVSKELASFYVEKMKGEKVIVMYLPNFITNI